MNWKPDRTAMLRTCLVSLLCLSPAISSMFVQAHESPYLRKYKAEVPPVEENPGRRESAGIRGDCLPRNQKLTVLVPENQVTLTTSPYPTFFFYVPTSEAEEAIFVLFDDNDREIYKSIIKVSEMSGLLKVSIPDILNSPNLEPGKNYLWQFYLICNPTDDSKNPFVEGLVQRVPLSVDISTELESASESQKVDIYADAGIWQEALTTLSDLRQANPNNLFLEKKWNELLENIGLEQLAQEPMIEP